MKKLEIVLNSNIEIHKLYQSAHMVLQHYYFKF